MDSKTWLKQLININTISSNSNLSLIQLIQSWFVSHHIDSQIIYSPNKQKANLLATIPASDGQKQGGILLSGHTDTVDVAGQIWDSDPFIAIEKDGKIYGRGTCDMKGFLAVILAMTPTFKQLNNIKPIHLAFTYDEEVGCVGVKYLIHYLKKHNIQPEGCIIGEPTLINPIIGEKSRRVYHCQVHGKASHSSRLDKGCNAIEYASLWISYIHKLAVNFQKNGPFDYDYDYPAVSITVNLISGGIASNVIPVNCEFILEIRYMKPFKIDEFVKQIQHYAKQTLEPEMQITFPEAAIYIDKISTALGFNGQENSTIVQTVRKVTGIEKQMKVSYSTEAGSYQKANMPAVILGPGNIAQAHSANEYIEIEQLLLFEKTLYKIVKQFVE